ncbi:hypothetical protein TGAM01_v208460, partial [Trichoderma gamsii]
QFSISFSCTSISVFLSFFLSLSLSLSFSCVPYLPSLSSNFLLTTNKDMPRALDEELNAD